jgi:antitoxin MazE
MRTKVQKWGNSLALRLPKALAVDAQLEENTPVKVSLVEGRLIFERVLTAPKWTLEELLAGVTSENLHGEIDTGAAAGHEAW